MNTSAKWITSLVEWILRYCSINGTPWKDEKSGRTHKGPSHGSSPEFGEQNFRHDFQAQQAQQIGINIIDAGHFETENIVCEYLYKSLKEKFGDEIEIKVSDLKNPINYM